MEEEERQKVGKRIDSRRDEGSRRSRGGKVGSSIRCNVSQRVSRSSSRECQVPRTAADCSSCLRKEKFLSQRRLKPSMRSSQRSYEGRKAERKAGPSRGVNEVARDNQLGCVVSSLATVKGAVWSE